MNAPLSRPVDLTLHIGTGKAGSSSIQAFLRDNRQRLGELGLLYPKAPGASRHVRLGLFIKSPEEMMSSPAWYRLGQPDPAKFRERFWRRLVSEVESSGLSRALLSDEVLFMRNEPALRRMRGLTDQLARSLRLVAYLRRQDDHMVSRYQQGVKTGVVMRLDEWAQQDMSDLYDYHSRLTAWRRVLEPTELVVRRFEPDRFVDGSLHQDFLDAAGIDVRVTDLGPVSKRNESLDAESVEFLRLLNLHFVENEGAQVGRIIHGDLVKRLTSRSGGPVLSLPARTLDGFMSQWEQANRAVALEILGDESGELFRAPRRTHHITTDQHLDPIRLDHFLERAEVPERLHASIRRLAEREATRR